MKKQLEDTFPTSKLKIDFYEWLNKNYSNHDKIEIYEVDDPDNARCISISSNEQIHLYKINVEYDKYRGMWYTVYVTLGNFKAPNEVGIMQVEKGIVKLSYNSDLSIYDIELFFDSLYDFE